MVDIVVGRIPKIGKIDSGKERDLSPIEARVLNVRELRRRRQPGPGRERRSEPRPSDPPGSRVLVLLVPEAHRLPENLQDGEYRILLRIVRR